MRRKAATPDVWTYRDEVLVATLAIVNDAIAGRLEQRPLLTSRFALAYTDDKLFAGGNYLLDWWGATGDGSYSYNRGFVAGTGLIGMGAMVGSLIGNSVARNKAVSAAYAASTVCWRPVDMGLVHVSNFGFYLSDGHRGFRFYSWDSVRQADIVGPTCVQFTASTDNGMQTWRLMSDWAELVFAFWALARHRNHPQWIDGSWYPFDVMRARARYHSSALPELLA